MTTTFDERDLRFAFDDDWIVVKWDDHHAFKDGLQRFQGTKAVDFLGLLRSEPWFIEVKDFREHRIENKARLSSGDLAREVACKVRDTLASLAWACGRLELDQTQVREMLRALMNRESKVPVVLWLEEDRPAPPAHLSALGEAIKREIQWINPKVIVMSRAAKKPLPGLAVTGVPGVPPA